MRSPAQLDAGRMVVLAVVSHRPRLYSLVQATEIARCYVDNSPTLRRI
jgi:hypothetical protein